MNNNIEISAVGVELNDETRDYIYKKIDGLRKFVDFKDENVSTDIRISRMVGQQRSGKVYRAEIGIIMSGKRIGARGDGSTVWEAIDLAKDAISKKISSYRGKRNSLFKKGSVKVKGFLKKFYR
ncbi:MAG: HPF/RaiA family ribosome-associated protein [Candidatus Pacebacteria bacterium]|nr:HPF/RaiA family ribosome-associated protein [Candidatus Paceibacterota bacterium]